MDPSMLKHVRVYTADSVTAVEITKPIIDINALGCVHTLDEARTIRTILSAINFNVGETDKTHRRTDQGCLLLGPIGHSATLLPARAGRGRNRIEIFQTPITSCRQTSLKRNKNEPY